MLHTSCRFLKKQNSQWLHSKFMFRSRTIFAKAELQNRAETIQGEMQEPVKNGFGCISRLPSLLPHIFNCGLLSHPRPSNECGAGELNDDLKQPCPSAQFWNSIITECNKSGKLDYALAIYQKMQVDGCTYIFDATYVVILKCCAILNDVRIGSEIHAEVARKGLLESNLYVANALVDMYVKLGFLTRAQQTFDNLLRKDLVSWNTLLAGYAESSQFEEVIKHYELMKKKGTTPDTVTFISLFKACCTTGSVGDGKWFHIEAELWGLLQGHHVVLSTVIDMYCKFGLLEEARYMFSISSLQDVVSWTTLIAGYVESGDAIEALKLFEQMQHESVLPNSVTYIFTLKACIAIGILNKAQQLHAMIEEQQLRNDLRIGNTLVDMYAKSGLLAEAKSIFDMLPALDVVSWTSLIGGYAEHGQGEEAIRNFEFMQIQGFSPNLVTFLSVLKACCNIGSTKKGLEMHAELERLGLTKSNIHIGTTLVDLYSKCGAMLKANETFVRLPIHCLASWNALVAGYAEQGLHRELFECFQRIKLQALLPNDVTYISIVEACGIMYGINICLHMHAEIASQNSLKENRAVMNSLVRMYAHQNSLSKAREVCIKIPIRDVITWTSLITGYAEHGYGQEAVLCFEQMQLEGIFPNAITLILILKCCSSVAKVREIHVKIETGEFVQENIMVGTALVDTYTSHGCILEAHHAFDKLSVQDIVAWNTLIRGYTEHGYDNEAVLCFEQMQIQGVSQDQMTLSFALKAIANIRAVAKGPELHAEIERQYMMQCNPILGNSLIYMYSKWGLVAKAENLFDKLLVKDAMSWTTLIAGYVENDFSEKALEILEQMQLDGVCVCATTLVYALKACSCIGALNKGQELHMHIERRGLLEKDHLIGTTLVDMYAKCGLISAALLLFDRISVRDVVLWTALMAGYAKLGETEPIFLVFEKMLGKNVRPNITTFVVLLSACTRAGLLNTSQTIFGAMSKDFGILPTLEHHTCMINILGLIGLTAHAEGIIDKMVIPPDIAVWRSMLVAYRNSGNLGSAIQAFQHAIY